MKIKLYAAIAALAVAWLIAGPALLGGRATYVTTYGNSMEPAVRGGDLVLVRPAADYTVGDTVAYRSDELNAVVLHRIVAVDDGRYTLQGDNNSWLDPEQPTRDDLVGKQWLHIPGGGTWLRRLTSPSALAAAAFLLVFSGGTAAHVRHHRSKDRRLMAQRTHASRHPFPDLSPALRPVALGVAALGVAGVMTAAVAWSRPIETVIPAEESVTSTVDFSYNATVEPSAAYDDTIVTDPQPVFRRLAEVVDVGLRYEGRPGTVTVDAELSTPGGWRSTMRLADPVQFDDSDYAGTVTLDLDRIQARADAAAEVIGLPATSVNVAVVPRVSVEGGDIAPRLELVLDAHALRLAGEESLTVEDSITVAGTTREAATVSALGRSVDVTTLRSLSVGTIALAVLFGVGLVITGRLTAPVAESQRVRRRYGKLVLPVMPIALPPGRPVIDVPGVESLAALAERYGLLVLHWSRSGVDTYVVQDEGTTYRYRAGHHSESGDDAVVDGHATDDARNEAQRI